MTQNTVIMGMAVVRIFEEKGATFKTMIFLSEDWNTKNGRLLEEAFRSNPQKFNTWQGMFEDILGELNMLFVLPQHPINRVQALQGREVITMVYPIELSAEASKQIYSLMNSEKPQENDEVSIVHKALCPDEKPKATAALDEVKEALKAFRKARPSVVSYGNYEADFLPKLPSA